ncbi:AmmeMemoRadiSam system protein A [Sulfurospirillum arcachonense]|uniref:AmmeMemoRadiSam system protein A n=1 Tax=Sulfurospirillum arcachonense TaxID=57666 RepID=UPI0004699786|nr:AmmeMemoRadiSam system protein A [Sulfurospirillum arcachonense]
MNISNMLLDIARQAIKDEFDYKDGIDIEKISKENPWINENGASFVTLTKNGTLRGCIGSLVASRPLIEDIISNAKNASFRDPRFPKLTREELNTINIEVSILTPAQLVNYTDIEDLKSKITPNVDGVILKLYQNQATFLPQVWEELPEFESFFAHLINKAGLPLDCFKNHPQIYKYQVSKYK